MVPISALFPAQTMQQKQNHQKRSDLLRVANFLNRIRLEIEPWSWMLPVHYYWCHSPIGKFLETKGYWAVPLQLH